MNENKAANTTVDENAATTAENTATSQADTGAPAASATEQNTAPAQQDNAAGAATNETDVTKTQAFAARLKEEKERAKTEAKAELEKEYAAKVVVPEVSLTHDEKTALRSQKAQRVNELVSQGNDIGSAYKIAADEMEEQKDDLLDSKRETAQQEAERNAALEAERTGKAALEQTVKDLEAKLAKFEATDKVKASNARAAAASVGSLTSEPADPGFISREDFQKLPRDKKRELTRSGKIYQFMKKWNK